MADILTEFELTDLGIPGYERVVEVREKRTGLHAIVAMHDVTMGPALGGLRMHPYGSKEEALNDVLRLAEGMTYKSAAVEAGFGGGKSVIFADPHRDKTEALLRAYAELLNLLDGSYICGKDMGMTSDDLAYIRQYSPYVAGAVGPQSSGDPSPYTAWGVLQGMHVTASRLWGSDSLAGRRVAVQGLGGVGMRLADALFWRGAELIVTDIDSERMERAGLLYGAQMVTGDEIISAEVDIFAPCARGGILNQESIEKLHCQAVVGGANNQLATGACGQQLHDRGILYAPDFVTNAGGLINGAAEFEPEGYNPSFSRGKVDQIGRALSDIYQMADEQGRATADIAIDLAKQKLASKEGARTYPVYYH